MKAFFILLLLTNIIFALIQWLLPYEQVKRKTPPSTAAETLRILDESDIVLTAQTRQADVETGETEAGFSGIPDQLCYTLGPFKEQQVSQEVALKFKQNKISISSRSSQEKEYRGMMVYVDGHATRAEAIATAESLAERGVRDYIVVNEPGKTNILSLGVFGLKKNAERRQKRISRMVDNPVKSEARYRNRTIYWLDYSETENENLTRFIDKLKIEKGISRISRQCG